MKWWQTGAEETLSGIAESGVREPHLMYLILQIGIFRLEIYTRGFLDLKTGRREELIARSQETLTGANTKLVIYKDNNTSAPRVLEIYRKIFFWLTTSALFNCNYFSLGS